MFKATLVGRLGKDAEVKQVGETSVINFSVATDQGYGDKKETLWVDVAYWIKNTSIAQYLTKGKQIAVAGDVSIRKWEGGAAITMRAQEIQLIGGKEGGEAKPVAAKEDPADDLPF